jgi:glycerol-3-phosphate acyltransferase PlsY
MCLAMTLAGTLLVAFLLGSFPTGMVVARRKGIDLRKVGSGNIGATNVARAIGKTWAAVVLVVDATKGALSVLLAARLSANPWLPALAGLSAVFGQVFSIFLRGRGGKGVSTSLGAGLALAPIPALACGGAYALLFGLFRVSSIGSLAAVLCFPVFLLLFGLASPPHLTFATAVAILVFARHRDNIRRLVRGQERAFVRSGGQGLLLHPSGGSLARMASTIATAFENVTADTKANIYFGGKVVSHTLRLAGGAKKTLGLIYPGEYHFGTDAPEKMEIVAGACNIKLDGSETWQAYVGGTFFRVPGKSGFTISVAGEITEYICSFE